MVFANNFSSLHRVCVHVCICVHVSNAVGQCHQLSPQPLAALGMPPPCRPLRLLYHPYLPIDEQCATSKDSLLLCTTVGEERSAQGPKGRACGTNTAIGRGAEWRLQGSKWFQYPNICTRGRFVSLLQRSDNGHQFHDCYPCAPIDRLYIVIVDRHPQWQLDSIQNGHHLLQATAYICIDSHQGISFYNWLPSMHTRILATTVVSCIYLDSRVGG